MTGFEVIIVAAVAALVIGVLVGPALLLVLWSCYAVACVRSFAHRDYFAPPEGSGTGIAYLFERAPSMIFVHGTFTVTAVLTTFWLLTRFRDIAEA